MTNELIATLAEVTSITAAGMRIKKPIKIPRPNRGKPGRLAGHDAPAADGDSGIKRAVSVLKATSRQVMRR